MKFYMHIVYIEKVRHSKFCCIILTNYKNCSILCIAAIRYIGPIWLVSIIIYSDKKMCVKFHQDSSETSEAGHLFDSPVDTDL